MSRSSWLRRTSTPATSGGTSGSQHRRISVGWRGYVRAMTTEDAQERADLLETLAKHRSFLRQTVSGLTDEQAGKRTTVSELCLGGLIKHVTLVEARWFEFIVGGPSTIGSFD